MDVQYVQTYRSMQNPKYDDSRDLFPVVLKGLLYILGVPKQIFCLKLSLIMFNLIINKIKKIYIKDQMKHITLSFKILSTELIWRTWGKLRPYHRFFWGNSKNQI